jgi:Spy/CpxP family protein refolding chaperone
MERRERAQKMRDIRTDLDAKMKPILNDEQWKKLEESRAKAREEAKKKGGRKG